MSFSVRSRDFIRSLNLSLALFLSLCPAFLPALATDASDKEAIQDTIFRYKAGLEVNPNDAKNRLKLAFAYLTNRELDKAIVEFQKAAKLTPEEPECYMGLGRVFALKGQLQEACDNLKEAVRLAPKDFAYRLKYASVLARFSKLDESIAEFRQAIKLNGNEYIAHRDYGACLGLKGDFVGEIAEEQKAIGLKSDDAGCYYYLGSAYADQGKRVEAKKNLLRCVALDKTYSPAFNLLSGVAAADGQFKEAIKYAQTALNLDPDNPHYVSALHKIKEASTAARPAQTSTGGKGNKTQ